MQLLETINNAICDDPQILFDYLGLDINVQNEKASTNCEIHGGDNPHALSLYFNDYRGSRGRFACYTHGCEKTFKSSLIGFTRGVLSARHCGWTREGDEVYGWNKTVNLLRQLYNIDEVKELDSDHSDRNQFVRIANNDDFEGVRKYICPLTRYLSTYPQRAEYYIKRGFSHEVLEKYYVRYCHRSDSKYYRRCFVPLLDATGRWLNGFSARITDDTQPKWTFSSNFPASISLYNYEFASEFVRRSRTCIITESPGNIWRLYEAGIYNAVGVWGTNGFNDYKRYMLDKLGVMKLVVAFDNDENKAGEKAAAMIQQRYGRFYNIVSVAMPPNTNDIADLSVEHCKHIFKGY